VPGSAVPPKPELGRPRHDFVYRPAEERSRAFDRLPDVIDPPINAVLQPYRQYLADSVLEPPAFARIESWLQRDEGIRDARQTRSLTSNFRSESLKFRNPALGYQSILTRNCQPNLY
jgi:hypothetical protein